MRTGVGSPRGKGESNVQDFLLYVRNAESTTIRSFCSQVLTCSRKQEDIDDLVREAKEKSFDVQASTLSRSFCK